MIGPLPRVVVVPGAERRSRMRRPAIPADDETTTNTRVPGALVPRVRDLQVDLLLGEGVIHHGHGLGLSLDLGGVVRPHGGAIPLILRNHPDRDPLVLHETHDRVLGGTIVQMRRKVGAVQRQAKHLRGEAIPEVLAARRVMQVDLLLVLGHPRAGIVVVAATFRGVVATKVAIRKVLDHKKVMPAVDHLEADPPRNEVEEIVRVSRKKR